MNYVPSILQTPPVPMHSFRCGFSGLIMLVGLVIYISTFKSEVGGKLKPKSTFQPAIFTYRYGFSFLLVVVGFMASEVSGTFAIFLYIGWHRRHWMKKAKQKQAALQRSIRSGGGSLILAIPQDGFQRRHNQSSNPLDGCFRDKSATKQRCKTLPHRGNSKLYKHDCNSLNRLEYLMYPDHRLAPGHCLRHPSGVKMARRHSGSLLNIPSAFDGSMSEDRRGAFCSRPNCGQHGYQHFR